MKYVLFLMLSFAINYSTAQYSKDILIGKGNPTFYGNGWQLQKEANSAFLKMKTAAAKQGIKIQVVSSYRSFIHQKRIWERKYKAFTSQGLTPLQAMKKIIEYSTIPGTSRHHWGTDLDIIDSAAHYSGSVLDPKKFEGNGPFKKLRDWLTKHSKEYGFYTVYTKSPNRKGFKYEPWHISYAPISIPMLKAYQKLDIQQVLKEQHISGSSYLTDEFANQYLKENILDINPYLLGK
ncbi:M15 family metallopeptidase [Zhouia sp. PK063]|uniref:M15 family metallopeptidase n=1 Tax=Zhouia sp. PK063 TaxID=3373602 RepID=UPI00379804F8